MRTLMRLQLHDMDTFLASIQDATNEEIKLAIKCLIRNDALDIKEMLGI